MSTNFITFALYIYISLLMYFYVYSFIRVFIYSIVYLSFSYTHNYLLPLTRDLTGGGAQFKLRSLLICTVSWPL